MKISANVTEGMLNLHIWK